MCLFFTGPLCLKAPVAICYMSSAHSPSFQSHHLRHSSFSNPSLALPISQLILQPFRCFTYVTANSPTLFSLLPRHRSFTYITWRAVHALSPGIGTTVWHSSPSLLSFWWWPERNFLRCKKRWKSLGARFPHKLIHNDGWPPTALIMHMLSTWCKQSAPATHHLLAYDDMLIYLAQLTMNFDWRYALYIHKLYHRPRFRVGGSWSKSLHLQPLL